MKGFWTGLAALLLLACNQPVMKELQPIPDAAYAKGVSAPFCGVLQGTLVVAGGANFPDKPLLEGGAKRVYRDIWAYAGGAWTHAGLLPDSTAYGATFCVGDALVLVGGNVCGQPSDQVVELRLQGGKAVLKTLPPLPVPMEQCGWAQEGENLYLVGQEGVFTCVAGEYAWRKTADLPEPLVQPVAYARSGKLFVWGGFNPVTLEVSDKGLCLADGAWAEAPSIPDGGTFVGATGTVLPDGRLAVVGGVNRAVFAKALHNGPDDRIPYLSQEPAWYRFRQEVFLFDGTSWSRLLSAPECALAGPGVAADASFIYVSGGELKPGVRSPKTVQIPY